MDWRELQTRCFAASDDTVTVPKHDLLTLLDEWGDAQQKIEALRNALKDTAIRAHAVLAKTE